MASLETAIAIGYFVGIASFFTPCAVGMVPAYLGYFLGAKQDSLLSRNRRILNGALFGLTTTAGFVVLFGAAGVALSAADAGARTALGASFFWIAIAMGAALIVLGLVTLFNIAIPFSIPVKAPQRRNVLGFFGFGIAYGLVSLSCNLPLFLGVVLGAITVGGPGAIAIVLLAFALGKGTMMTLASLLVSVPKESMDLKRLVKLTPKIKQASGVALLVGGVVMIGYYGWVAWEISRASGAA